MDEHFDPYHKWLGIPPKDQPPTHYRLLGLELLESDPDVIENAADQRMRHVRSVQHGQHQALSQQVLNEISAAKICLLDPEKKAEYDQQFTGPKMPVIATGGEGSPSGSSKAAPSRRRKEKNPVIELIKIVAGGLGGVVISFLILSFLREDWDMLGIAKAVRGGGKTTTNPDKGGDSPLTPINNDPVTPLKPPPIKPNDPPKVNTPAKKMPALVGDVEVEKFEWNKDKAAVDLGPAAESFVVLSGVFGHFLGNGERMVLKIDDQNHYQITGGGVQLVGGNVTRVRSPYRKWFEDKVEAFSWRKGQPKVKLIHKNDGFAILSGVQGCFLGSDHAVSVALDPADGYWYLDGRTNFDTQGQALVYRFKQPGQFRPQVEEIAWNPGDPKLSPLATIEGLCSVSSISGAFKGGGENLNTAVEKDGRWHVWVSAHQPSTRGSFACIKFATPEMLALSAAKPKMQLVSASAKPPDPEPVKPMPEPVKPKVKGPPPSAEAIASAEKAVADLLSKDDIDALMTASADSKRSTEESYVLLLAARDKAAAQGDCIKAMNINDKLLEAFEVDRFATQSDTLLKLAKACETAQSNQILARMLLQHVDRAIQDKRTDNLEALAQAALAAARKSNDQDLAAKATLALIQARKKGE